MRIGRFDEYSKGIEMAERLFAEIAAVNEANEEKDIQKGEFKKEQDNIISHMIKGIKSDTKFHFDLILTFSAGLGAIYPIINSLLAGKGMVIDTRTVVLLTIAAVYLIVLEEKKHIENKEILEKEAQIVLSELQLSGFPNANTGTRAGSDNPVLNLVQKTIKSCVSIFGSVMRKLDRGKAIFRGALRGAGAVSFGLLDMLGFGFASTVIMNAIHSLIGLYHFDTQAFITNAAFIVAGITSLATKHGFAYIVNKLSNLIKMDTRQKEIIKKDIEELEKPVIKRVSDFDEGEPINEQ